MMFGWLKEETKEKTDFGDFLELYDIKQEWLAKKSKTSQSLISLLTSDHSRTPKPTTAYKLIKVLREFESNIKKEDFW
ncbi:transcriptional regulator [Peribacillus simplex]|nr:transcriptional regulator [Peribacillus simplex]